MCFKRPNSQGPALSGERNYTLVGSKQIVDKLPRLLVNGLHSPHLGWGGTVQLAWPPPSSRASPWHQVNDLQSVCEPVRGVSRGPVEDEKNHLQKRGQDRKEVCSVGLSAAETTAAQKQAPKARTCTTDRRCCHGSLI